MHKQKFLSNIKVFAFQYKWKYRRHVKEVHKAVELVRGTLKTELTCRLNDPDVSSKEDILSLLIQTMSRYIYFVYCQVIAVTSGVYVSLC